MMLSANPIVRRLAITVLSLGASFYSTTTTLSCGRWNVQADTSVFAWVSISKTTKYGRISRVVVMGSSTTSDKTINTSTDSAATALTSITGTDDTAPPHYHRGQDSYEFEPPSYANPQSATDAIDSPRPGPAKFIFDVPIPEPHQNQKKVEKRNKTQVSQPNPEITAPSTSIQVHDKIEPPKSPKVTQTKYETHFNFDPETVRRGSETKKRDKEYYKDEVSRLRKQLEGTEVFTTTRRRSSTHQHSVPPPSSRRQSTAAQVHVTANPLDSASSMPAGRTTIVVQQPSLSLDYGGCSTILIRDGEEGRRSSRACDHIQQLLDVTSQFTSEDLHEFDKRYGSPHHSRSQSVKAARSRTGERQLLGLPQQRARVASMPNTGVEEEYYRLRHFSITGKGVVNRGDSLRSRRSRSNTSVASSASSTEAVTRASAPCSLASSRDSSAGLSSYRVLVLGGPGVGKSSLVGQFMTSEYLHAYDTSIDDDSGEKSVCVLLAGEESEITFLDSPPDNFIAEGCAHGYCVVYSTADRASFAEAEKRLQTLWAAGHTTRRAVILVGNKADLARSRVVPTDARPCDIINPYSKTPTYPKKQIKEFPLFFPRSSQVAVVFCVLIFFYNTTFVFKMNCTKCNESLTDSVSCAQCSGAYHYVCAGVSETSYKKMGPEKRAAWRCITCRAVVSTDNTTNAEILRELKNLKSEFNSFKLDLDTVKRDTHDTVDAVRELTLSWTSLETRINLIEERMGELELKITKISTDCDSSREEVALLKHNHNLQDQFSRLNNVEILGVPSKSGENLHNIVSDICAVTGFRLEPTDVDTVHRVRQFATHDGQAPGPRPLCVYRKDRYDTVTSGETGAGPSRGGGVLIAVERGLRVRRGRLVLVTVGRGALEGKALATSYECKFIETSVGINHNVDELLVGLLTQIRLKQQHAERVRKRSSSRKNRSRARSPLEEPTTTAPAPSSASSTPRKRTRLSASVKVRGLLGRVWARDSKSKSCENLHVL
ncbi:unnamed protein product [Leptosia nina]|uniref:PHD-type domain-containing protein n=1 Tax=Leptosia nina TaxID=320188 RepID=A0AAV1J2I9_9NEOP